MKILFILLIAIAISKDDLGDWPQCSNIKPSYREQCTSIGSIYGYTRCCYESFKASTGESKKSCWPLTYDEFNNVKNYIAARKEKNPGCTDYSFDCSSKFISISLILLLLNLL